MIEATNLHKHFGKVVAVGDVTLRAADGRITGLLGPNGAGKSTTLRILYTVQDFLVEDRPISAVEDHLTGSLAEPKATSLTLPFSCWQVCELLRPDSSRP